MHRTAPPDLRQRLFAFCDIEAECVITVESDGVISGAKIAAERFASIGIDPLFLIEDGAKVSKGQVIARFLGTPLQITEAEERVIGSLSKYSGIASAAYAAVTRAAGRIRIVSGAWKKMPIEIKSGVREAVLAGGASFRILDRPFIYLDKNYVRIFGGVTNALRAAAAFPDLIPVIQVKGEVTPLSKEVKQALLGGAGVIMVDTGRTEDLATSRELIDSYGFTGSVLLAFAGGVTIDSIPELLKLGVDILDIGTEIIDAPLLDMKLDVIKLHPKRGDGS